jgi:hypothetical protein
MFLTTKTKKMKATELRIGNWVQFRHTETPVLITLADFVREYKEEHLEDYEPIPLTEEWLERFGFENGANKNYKSIKLPKTSIKDAYLFVNYVTDSRLPYARRGIALVDDFEEETEISIDIEIKHVHQLQNLYFAITGVELTKNK